MEQHAEALVRRDLPTAGSTVHLQAASDVIDEIAQLYRSHDWAYDTLSEREATTVIRGRKPVLAARVGGREVIVKRLHHGGFLAPLLGDRFLTPRRLSAHIANAAFLREHAIDTPAVIFIAWRQSRGFTRGEIGLERIEGVDADRYFFGGSSPAAADATARAIGALVRRMHDVGFVHGDLNLMNIFVRAPLELSILDLDKGSILPHPPVRARRGNLERLYRSIRKQGRERPEAAEEVIRQVEAGYGEDDEGA